MAYGACPICRKTREICHSKRAGCFCCVDCHFACNVDITTPRSGTYARMRVVGNDHPQSEDSGAGEPEPHRVRSRPFTHRDPPLQAA